MPSWRSRRAPTANTKFSRRKRRATLSSQKTTTTPLIRLQSQPRKSFHKWTRQTSAVTRFLQSQKRSGEKACSRRRRALSRRGFCRNTIKSSEIVKSRDWSSSDFHCSRQLKRRTSWTNRSRRHRLSERSSHRSPLRRSSRLKPCGPSRRASKARRNPAWKLSIPTRITKRSSTSSSRVRRRRTRTTTSPGTSRRRKASRRMLRCSVAKISPTDRSKWQRQLKGQLRASNTDQQQHKELLQLLRDPSRPLGRQSWLQDRCRLSRRDERRKRQRHKRRGLTLSTRPRRTTNSPVKLLWWHPRRAFQPSTKTPSLRRESRRRFPREICFRPSTPW